MQQLSASTYPLFRSDFLSRSATGELIVHNLTEARCLTSLLTAVWQLAGSTLLQALNGARLLCSTGPSAQPSILVLPAGQLSS